MALCTWRVGPGGSQLQGQPASGRPTSVFRTSARGKRENRMRECVRMYDKRTTSESTQDLCSGRFLCCSFLELFFFSLGPLFAVFVCQACRDFGCVVSFLCNLFLILPCLDDKKGRRHAVTFARVSFPHSQFEAFGSGSISFHTHTCLPFWGKSPFLLRLVGLRSSLVGFALSHLTIRLHPTHNPRRA